MTSINVLRDLTTSNMQHKLDIILEWHKQNSNISSPDNFSYD